MSHLRYRMLDRALALDAIPDPALRLGSRWGALLRERHERRGGVEAQEERLRALLAHMTSGPIAESPELANDQHYELPAEFFALMLGPRRKYSCCLWEPTTTTLATAEETMLELTCSRAAVEDGMRILDLGCGWGSLSLWLAERFPSALVTAVSNSRTQRAYIEQRAAALELGNLDVVTADVNAYQPPRRFDLVISVEMFEHMRNWRELLRRIAGWLHDDGHLFVHVFSHRTVPYLFDGTWAAERFFTAGLMPSHELLTRFQEHMQLTDRWAISGTHYARTLHAWLERLDADHDRAAELLCDGGRRSSRQARALLACWRLFLISAGEIWARDDGDSWLVSQYLMQPRLRPAVDFGAGLPRAHRSAHVFGPG